VRGNNQCQQADTTHVGLLGVCRTCLPVTPARPRQHRPSAPCSKGDQRHAWAAEAPAEAAGAGHRHPRARPCGAADVDGPPRL